MKKGEHYEGMVIRMEFPNRGIVEVDGEKAVVKNALPGQKVSFAVTKRRKGNCQGRLLKVIEPSELEAVKNPCAHAGICGGCLYQTIPYEAQLKIKEEQVRYLLETVITDRSYGWEGILPSPVNEGYRNKMEYSFGDEWKEGPLALGMHKRGSFYDIVNVMDCRIVHPDFTRVLTATKDYFSERKIPYYRKLQHTGFLRHLLVRRAVKTGEILVALVTSSQRPGDEIEETELIGAWMDCMKDLEGRLEGRFAGILHIVNDSLADIVQCDQIDVLYGQDYFQEELLGLKFKISPFSFFQTNSLGAEVLYETARGYVGDTKDKVVFDLYSGTGTIAQMLAPVARKVVGVEIVEEAVGAAKENAKFNGLDNCEFICGDVLRVIDEITDKPDLIVLDPPRDGIHPKALDKIIDFAVDKIVYISCKPTSLVRDLAVLQEGGYLVERGCCVDMFPGTANCETVCLLSRIR